MEECAYCNREVKEQAKVPAKDDAAAWDKLAKEHAPDCEWIITRAHRTDPATWPRED
jgi:hypothetical protein